MAKKKSRLADGLNLEEADATPVIRSLTSTQIRPVRVGKKQIGGYFDKTVHDNLAELAFRLTRKNGQKVTIQSLMEEALSDLFKKHKSQFE